MLNKPLIILGSGGHAMVLVEIIRELGHSIACVISPDKPASNEAFKDIPHFTSDDRLFDFNKNEVLLVNGIGSLPGKNTRIFIHEKLSSSGYKFTSVISPKAIVSSAVKISPGAQVLPGAIINVGSVIQESTIVNTGAIVDHDCEIGPHSHLAPGVSLCGNVKIGSNVYVGTGSSIIQNIIIGDEAVIAAGSTVYFDVKPKSKVITDLKFKG